MKTIGIIGGGITGLTTAFGLQRQGIPVTVYEAGSRAGGVIQSVRQDGYLAEFGPNTVLETSPKIAALISDLGLLNRRMYSDPQAEKRYIVRGGKPVPVAGSAAAFLKSPLFSWPAKLRLAWEPFVRRASPEVEESLGHFVKRRIGQEFLDYAINPFVAGVYAGDPERLSVKHAFPKLHSIEQKYGSLILGQFLGARERKRRAEVSKQNAKKVSFDEGLEVLTDTLRRQLGDAVHLHSPAVRVAQESDGWTITARQGDQLEQHEHSAVIYTGPAYRLAQLQVTTQRPLNFAPMAEVKYPPVASVVLGFRRADVAHPLDGFGMLIPEVERFRILGTLFSSTLFPNRAPEGYVTLTNYIGGTRAPELATRPPSELVEMAVQDLRSILGVQGQPTFQHTFVFPKAIPQYEVGYGRFKELLDAAEAAAPGLFFAGNYRDGVSLGDSIVSGCNMAERAAQYVRESVSREVCEVA